jgi:dynein heavy chain, axonemal
MARSGTTLPPPLLSSTHAGSRVAATTVPRSPTRAFPDPLSSTHTGAVKDVVARTYSSISDESFLTAVDRIARFYSPSSAGLSWKVLQQHLRSDGRRPVGSAIAAIKSRRGSESVDQDSKTTSGGHARVVETAPSPAVVRLWERAPGLAATAAAGASGAGHGTKRGFAKALKTGVPARGTVSTVNLAMMSPVAMSHSLSASALNPARQPRALSTAVAATSPAGHAETVLREREFFDAKMDELEVDAPPPSFDAVNDALLATMDAVVRGYWAAVSTVASPAAIAPLREEWEEGVLARLGMSEGLPKPWLAPPPTHTSGALVAEGDLQGFVDRGHLDEARRLAGHDGAMAAWVSHVLQSDTTSRSSHHPSPHLGLVPGSHLPFDSATGQALLASGASPAALVEAMFHEMHADYFGAVCRSMLDYDLRAPDPRLHHGLEVALVDSMRWTPRRTRSREELEVDPVSVPASGQRLARRLFVTEELIQTLNELFCDPTSGFQHVKFVDGTSETFRGMLPLSTADLCRTVADSVDQARSHLRTRWHKECVEAVAAFKLAARGQSGTAGKGGKRKALSEAEQRIEAFPQEADFQRFARKVDEAREALLDEHHRRMVVLQLAAQSEGLAAQAAFAAAVRTPRDVLPPLSEAGGALPVARAQNPGGAVAPTPFVSALAVRSVIPDAAAELDGLKTPAELRVLREKGGVAAATALMALHLRELVFHGIESFTRLLQSYLPPEDHRHHGRREHVAGPATVADGAEEDGTFRGLLEENERTPLVTMTLAIEYREGSASHAATASPDLEKANDNVKPATQAGEEQAAAEFEAFKAKRLAEDPEAVVPAHGPERRPSLQKVDMEGRVYKLGEEARALWAGDVSIVLDPAWEAIEGALVKCGHSILEGGDGFTKPDVEIAKYSSDKDDAAAESDDSFLANVSRSDSRMVDLRNLCSDVVHSNMDGPESLKHRFKQFESLFGTEEKARLLRFCLDRHKKLKDYVEEFRRYQRLNKAICDSSHDFEVFRLVQVGCFELKHALCSRVRLLASILARNLKLRMLSRCATLNDRYEYLRKRLLFKPRDSEELVEHAEFAKRVPDDVILLQEQFRGIGGCAKIMTALYGEFLPWEALPSHTGFASALGPTEGGKGDNAKASRSRARPGSLSSEESVALNSSQHLIVKETLTWPARIREAQTAARETLDAEKKGQLSKLELAIGDFDASLADCRDKLEALRSEGAIEKYAAAMRVCREVHAVLDAALEKSEVLNKEQDLLGLELTDWRTPITEMLEELGPFERLWEGTSTFMEQQLAWYGQPLLEVEPEEADKQGESCKASAARSLKELPEDADAPRSMAQQVRDKSQRFLITDLPLLVLLSNPGLKQRHWDEMESSVGFRIPHNPRTNLSDMLRLGLEERIGDIEETCVVAAKEYSLEKALEKMQADWAPVELDLRKHKNTGTYILSGASVDEVQALLDDHIVKAQTMAASRFAKSLLSRIKDWVSALTEIQNVVDAWIKVQTSWLYLEPIFSSEDIMQQMPEEGRRFKIVDTTWRELMKGAVADPAALRAMRQEGMEDRLREANELLDLIGKGLNSYLETKRLYFPRFFFLSNDELLEILAETKDPTRVQPHLKKCFEGIHSLEFDDKVNILAMISGEGERVVLSSPHADGHVISPAESRGNVEVWLDWVENAMRRSVARSLDDALRAYPSCERTEWVTQWPGQAVLAGSQTYWTHGVEKALREKGAVGIREYGDTLRKYINDIIMLVRGDLPKLVRQTLSALTVLDVHSRDVTIHMGEVGVESEYDFEWNSQLRYYWKDDGVSQASGNPGSMVLRMINAQVLYANEYLGNSGRLVITPLTDRCYRTLVGAVHLGYGGAPEGPAGTGKTETTKDLAKAAGMMCVVYNCSDQLGVLEMAKFFKGLASSGAWACFDEFNRINLEVLSVVAQQIMEIQFAIKERKDRFVFYGTEISLRWTANVFITMNPGYAGRSELPDNLKSLFRSVAMMVPDYAMISEIILYSYGYLEAKDLARKIVATYKLCSEQLSSQFHYDYGMRAVMAVLRAAGNLKRDKECASLDESILILRAIVDVNLPKFLSPDIPLFNGIAQDLFPGVVVPPADRGLFLNAMARAADMLGLQLEPVVRAKVIQLYEMMIVRHGFMLVGLPWAGKTAAMKILSLSMKMLHEENPDDPRWAPIHLVVMNPKSVTLGQLYGRTDPVTKEWTNGILADNYRRCASGKVGNDGDRQWVVFDGPVDAIWIENMNTVLDDNKKLCLMSGEIIAMSSTMSMVFETKDLAAASPATVSRCGMVYLEPHVLGWRPIVISWLEHLADDNPKFPFRAARASDKEAMERQAVAVKAAAEANAASGTIPEEDPRPFTLDAAQRGILLQLFDLMVEPCLVLLRKELVEYCPTQDTSLVWQLTNLFETTLSQSIEAARTAGEGKRGGGDDSAVAGGTPPGHYAVGNANIKGQSEFSDADLRSTFLFALVWSVGATLDEGARKKMDEMIKGIATGSVGFIKSHRLHTFFRVKGWMSPDERAAEDAKIEEGAMDPETGLPMRHNAGAKLPTAVELPALPPKGETLYDSIWCAGEGKWRLWESCLPSSTIPQGAVFHEIVVPTTATLQFDHIVNLLLTRKRRLLVCGPTGTGKSVLMKRLLLKSLPRESWLPIVIGFSAQTTAFLTQDQVDRKMERRRKGVHGPRPGQTCVVFVDDLNMPQIEEYGAQPPIELLRQLIDNHGWYNLEDNSFMRIEDTLVAAAMGPPGGGRNTICPRIQRHLNTFCMTEISRPTLQRVFSAIVTWFVKGGTSPKEAAPFPDEVARLDKAIVSATLDLYERAQEVLRPTPAKTHYTFNLRDFARVVQGVLLVTPDACSTAEGMTRLWIHESLRVFHDRLINDDDRSEVVSFLRELTSRHFSKDFDAMLEHLPTLGQDIVRFAVAQPDEAGGDTVASAAATKGAKLSNDDARLLFWCDFVGSGSKRAYKECTSASSLVGAIRSGLEDYNAQSKSPMDLVPFLFFLEHVSRISRIIKMPGGHALLVGVGGSGRQCATRLAGFMAGYKLIQVELSKSYGKVEWQDDLKRIMREAGTGPQPVVFLFSDTQIKWQGMVEDINSILNSGEVPNLFAPDERAELYEKLGPLARAAGLGKDLPPDELYAYFVERLKANLHIVLAMSPIGDAFRDRLRKFPSLVNCCTIDWFTSWPSDALEAVALKHLQQIDADDRARASIAAVCQHFHQSVRRLSEAFRVELRRHNYVTPTSYLELLGQFKRSLKAKHKEVSSKRNRYVVGLEKLDDAAKQVAGLQKQLEEMQPVLLQSQKDTAALMEEIQAKLPGVEEVRARVSADAEVASKEEAEVKAVADECEADLAEAMPALNEAIDALNTLEEKDIKFIKALANPSAVIVMVMSAVLVLLGEKPDKIKDPAGGMKKVDDYWGPAKKMLNDSKGFLARLVNYDRDNIDPKLIGKVREQFISQEDFNRERAGTAAKAAEGMCAWCIAMDKYERVAKLVAPKRAALATAMEKLAVTQANLSEKRAALKKVEDELGALQTRYDAALKRKEELAAETELCAKKLKRAEQLITSLGGEKDRWTERALDLKNKLEALTGDVLLSAGVISYLGAFTMDFRGRCIDNWVRKCASQGISCSVPGIGDPESSTLLEFSVSSVLGDPIKIQQWHIDGLPTDAFSTDNGVIVDQARRWPLMIDPQGQANKWIKNMEKDNNLVVLKQTDTSFLRSMENAIQFGQPVLLENVGEELDPTLEPVLLKVLFKQGASWCIRLGDATVEYDDRFKLYITTKYRNPHYLPETSTKVSLLNFMITPAGLQDQLLGVVVAAERPDLEKARTELVILSAANNKTLAELESRILTVLSESKGNILEDETAIQVLNESKALANEIAEKQKAALATEREIDETRAGYTPVASHTARLFFVTADMGNIDPMYQYSMTWFNGLFLGSIRSSKKSDNLTARIQSLNDHFTYSLFRNVCRSLFERHKLLFSLLLCIRILQGRGEVDDDEWLFLITGGVAMENPFANPAPEWLSERAWGEICRLSDLRVFKGLREHVESQHAAWREVYDSEAPHHADLPGEWGTLGRLSRMQKLLVLRTIRPDKVILAVQEFVESQMGEQFLKPPPFDLKGCHEDSNPGQPLIFVLSPGSDPMPALVTFADAAKCIVQQISLGQGQGKFAEEMIERGREDGSWVVLQNCHLAPSWMPSLEKICEDLAESQAGKPGKELPNPSFRLWLTSYPSNDFPVSILQNGVKMTNEPPKGLRANLMRSYLSDPIADPKFFAGVKNAEPFRRLLFGLCFFHAMVQERRQFGPLGWNIPYEFTESDLRISVRQLAMFLDDPAYAPKDATVRPIDAVPYVTLRYLTGECNYGGRVTDDKDRRCLMSILDMFYCLDMHTPGRLLSSSGEWSTPEEAIREHRDYVRFIDALPTVPAPEVFGLHANATITKDNKETTELFADILLTQAAGGGGGGSGSGGKSRDDTISEVATDVLAKVRGEYDLEEVGAKYPVDWAQSMNTVLRQELARFNRLLAVIQSSLKSVQKALKGLVVMSATLERVGTEMFFGRVPSLWLKSSYPSLKPLGGYVSDLVQRTTFLDTWIRDGTPNIFWLPGFYFTHSFLTGVMQNFARKETVPIDTVEFDVEFLSRSKESLKKAPEDGAYVWGLFFDGARWDMGKMQMGEQEPKQLFAPAPVMWMRPKRQKDLAVYKHYNTPVYKTTERRGTLSTTGHSTNFVMMVRSPTDKSEDHWIRRGVAMILALDD